MRKPLLYLGVFAALGVAGCSSDAAGVSIPGPTGAGLAVRIVSIIRDSAGYTVQFKMTSEDKGMLSLNPACDWRVDVLANNAWTVLGANGSCQLFAIGLSPGQSMTSSVHAVTDQALASGTALRIAIGWGINQESLSDPAPVN